MTPNTQGGFLGAKSKNQNKFKFKAGIATEAMNKDPSDMPVKKNWAQVASLVIPQEIMEQKKNAKYAERLIQQNNIKPDHIIEPKETRRPKVANDMEKIASMIGKKL